MALIKINTNKVKLNGKQAIITVYKNTKTGRKLSKVRTVGSKKSFTMKSMAPNRWEKFSWSKKKRPSRKRSRRSRKRSRH